MARTPRPGIYLLPNLLTTAALFFGFYAIVAAVGGHYREAAVAVFVTMAFDLFDGRVARLIGAQSDFGMHYDSLSDAIGFGIAPALLLYHWALADVGKAGWVVSFSYVAATALRLARFNAQASQQDKRFFQGLPSPAAAGVLAGYVWVSEGLEWARFAGPWLAGLALTILALLMVSNLRYHSFKELNLKGRVRFFTVPMIVLAFMLVAVRPSMVLFVFFVLYALSGPLNTLLQIRRRRLEKKRLAA